MKVAIIGGSGKMGRWFARFLRAEGLEVVITGRNDEKLRTVGGELGVAFTTDNAMAVAGAGVVVFSVPIDGFAGVVAAVAPHIRPEQVVVDVTSAKVSPVAAMHEQMKANLVLGVHPVFGPGAKGVANQNFVLTPTTERESELAEKVRNYIEARGARVTLMTPREHDEMMAVILGLAHFIAIVAADTLVSFDKLREMEAVSGTTYRVLLTLVESVIAEDAGLYASLQMSLPEIAAVEERFRERVQTWGEVVAGGDKDDFIARMEAIRDRFEAASADFGRAYADMYRIVEGR